MWDYKESKTQSPHRYHKSEDNILQINRDRNLKRKVV